MSTEYKTIVDKNGDAWTGKEIHQSWEEDLFDALTLGLLASSETTVEVNGERHSGQALGKHEKI